MSDTARWAETLQALLRDAPGLGVLQQPVGAVPATASGVAHAAHGSVDASAVASLATVSATCAVTVSRCAEVVSEPHAEQVARGNSFAASAPARRTRYAATAPGSTTVPP
nr:hypothetical protein [Nocardia sputorum]